MAQEVFVNVLNEIASIKPKTRRNTMSCRMKDVLIQELPNCFKKGDQKLPLCLGIHIQVHTHYKDETRFEPKLIQKGLNKYCSGTNYLSKIIEGVPRIDIHGKSVGIVTAEEATYSLHELQKRKDQQQKKMVEKAQALLKKTETQQPPLQPSKPKEMPKPISLEELKKRSSTCETSPAQALSKEDLKLQKQLRYAKKIARQKGASSK